MFPVGGWRKRPWLCPQNCVDLQPRNMATPHFLKTRMAPTPSGYLHLGNILSFVLTQALAARHGDKVLLRIDDMDRDRAAPHFIEDIFDTLHFLELPWQEGPVDASDFALHFAQHHRLPLYQNAVQQLIDGGHVFACTCSRADVLRQNAAAIYPGTCLHKGLPLNTPNSALRLKTPGSVLIQVHTLNGVQSVPQFPEALRYFVVRKKDGMPAYQLCSVMDDVHFGVDLVVRGADLWHSTLAQLYLATLLDVPQFARTTFVHHPLLVSEGGDKLSKSAGATSVFGMRKEGYTKDAVYRAVARMLAIDHDVTNWQELAAAMQTLPGWSGGI